MFHSDLKHKHLCVCISDCVCDCVRGTHLRHIKVAMVITMATREMDTPTAPMISRGRRTAGFSA